MRRFATSHVRAAAILMGVVCAQQVAHGQFQKADLDRVDAYIEGQLREANIPGAAIAIVDRDRILHLRGYGVAGPNLGPVTQDTSFVIGSVSKSITALAVMRLVEASNIELDAPVQRYLPWFDVSPHDDAEKITVRHLLNQTSGLSVLDGALHYGSRDNSDSALETRVRDLARARLRSAPGTAFQYSNANYDVAGAIVAAVSRVSYEDYVERHVFAPLKMSRSVASVVTVRNHGLAQGHRYWFGRPVAEWLPTPRCMIPSGYLAASAADIGRLLRLHLNGGTLDGEQFLSPESIAVLHRPAASVTGTLRYAMGWYVSESDGRTVLAHEGSTADYRSLAVLVPSQGWGFTLLVNSANVLSGPNVAALGPEVRRLLLGGNPRPIRKAAGLFTPNLVGVTVLLLLQILAALHTVHLARRWKRHGTPHRRGRLQFVWHFVLPPIVCVVLAIVLLFVLPRANGTNLSGVRMHAPDGWVLMVLSAGFALVWAPARTVILVRSSRGGAKPRAAVSNS